MSHGRQDPDSLPTKAMNFYVLAAEVTALVKLIPAAEGCPTRWHVFALTTRWGSEGRGQED